MFLSDQETEVDLLYYESIARTVVKLIGETQSSAVTIGVHGDWGAGKSSVLKMTSAAYEGDDRVLCLWFNGWAFEGFDDAKTVVIETIVEELRRARPASAKVAEAARKVLKRVDWLKIAKKTGGLAFTAMTGLPTFDQLQSIVDVAKSVVEKPQDHISVEDIKSVADQIGDYMKAPKEEADHLPAQIHEFRKEFEELLNAADIDKLVVIVDDLDRCLPETAIATLEAIRLFLFVPRTAFVIGADELMIEYAVREHFPDLPPSSGPVPYARNYLEKLIQVPFRIPALGLNETRMYVFLLLAENALGATDDRFKRLLDAARKDLQKPWQSKGLDRTIVRTALGSLPGEIEQALVLSAQISKILSEGTRGNPRQIKRFLNSMMLRYAIAVERQFADDIETPILAKLMLAERFSSDLYDQVARLAATAGDGKCTALGELEDHVRAEKSRTEKPAKRSDKKPAKDEPAAEVLSEQAQKWAESEWARSWAAIDPPLKEVDLQPYIFVTRDKRGYFGSFAASSHLEAIVEKLMGPRLVVRQSSSELAKLTGTDPEQVFDALRGRIADNDKYNSEPSGVQGLIALVAAHPALQRRLLTFVNELPVAKLGAWGATSWSGCFTDPALITEFSATLKTWSEQNDNAVLRTSAAAALRFKRKG
jgi:predicted KAP-like P-loop ATPase